MVLQLQKENQQKRLITKLAFTLLTLFWLGFLHTLEGLQIYAREEEL